MKIIIPLMKIIVNILTFYINRKENLVGQTFKGRKEDKTNETTQVIKKDE